jgi:hypothetical protein
MDKFIRGDFRMSVENHYCQAYTVTFEDEIVAIFALSFDSLDLDSDDKEELQSDIFLNVLALCHQRTVVFMSRDMGSVRGCA